MCTCELLIWSLKVHLYGWALLELLIFRILFLSVNLGSLNISFLLGSSSLIFQWNFKLTVVISFPLVCSVGWCYVVAGVPNTLGLDRLLGPLELTFLGQTLGWHQEQHPTLSQARLEQTQTDARQRLQSLMWPYTMMYCVKHILDLHLDFYGWQSNGWSRTVTVASSLG